MTEPLYLAEVYDPVTGTFSPTGDMTVGRVAHTATLLTNGKVLITGGFLGLLSGSAHGNLSNAEIYNPESGSFTITDSMHANRFWHSATRLLDGSVLIAGGSDGDNSEASAEIYKY